MTEKILIIHKLEEKYDYNFTDLGIEVYRPNQLGVDINLAEITITYGWNNILGKQILQLTDSNLKWVHAISAGVDSLPLAEFFKRNIILTNSSGIHARNISQSVLAYIMYFVRDLNSSTSNQLNKVWPGRSEIKPRVMQDFTYTIFGTGQIGQQIAQLLKPFGVKTIGINSTGHPVDNFDETLALSELDNRVWDSDVIINVMPLNDATNQFFNRKFFNHFVNLFLFVNVGRGPSVNSNDLVDALRNKKVQHAALDVFETEPLESDSAFWTQPNVLVTPHSTGVVAHFQQTQMNLMSPNLHSFLKDGTVVKNQVSLEKGY